MASHRKTDLVVDAVTMAVHHRGGHVPGVIHHRDRGGECSSYRLERELRRPGALASMGSVADCYDNAMTRAAGTSPSARSLPLHTSRRTLHHKLRPHPCPQLRGVRESGSTPTDDATLTFGAFGPLSRREAGITRSPRCRP